MVCKPSVERRSHYACARRVFPALGKPTASAYWTSRSASASSSSVEWGEADGAILRVWPAAEPIAVEFTEAESSWSSARSSAGRSSSASRRTSWKNGSPTELSTWKGALKCVRYNAGCRGVSGPRIFAQEFYSDVLDLRDCEPTRRAVAIVSDDDIAGQSIGNPGHVSQAIGGVEISRAGTLIVKLVSVGERTSQRKLRHREDDE
jgi:hypothetical protein